MAGYQRADSSNQIADGNTIEASVFDAEFDAIVAAFNVSSGHSHDGSSAGEGPQITASGIANNAVALGTKTTGNYVATITGGTGIASTGATSGETIAHTLSVDLSELTDMTAAMVATDEFIVLDNGADRRKAASEIPLSIFNNDSGFTTTSGTVTSVALSAGNLIDISGSTITSSGTFTVNVDLSELTDMTQTITNSDEFVVLDGSVQKRKQASEIPISIFNNDSGFITSSTTSLPIENSSNATQFTSTNSTGLQFAAGGSASVAFDATNKRVTYTVTESDPAALAFAIALG